MANPADRAGSSFFMTGLGLQVVLLGAGHTHLYVVRHARRLIRRGVALTLVDPGKLSYSGLATGVLGGRYEPEEDEVDAASLAKVWGARFIRGRAEGVDRACPSVVLTDGQTLPYDILSVNVGSEVPTERIRGAAEHAVAVKPITNLFRLRELLESRLRVAGSMTRVVVIGGGPTASEVAANIRALADQHPGGCQVTVITSGERLLSDHSPAISSSLTRALRGRGVELVVNARIERLEGGVALAGDGRRFDADVFVCAIGLCASSWVRDSGLPVDEQGGLPVDATLRCVEDDRVFGAGDCISFEGGRLPKVGVFGVRQSRVLLNNLLASAVGSKELDCYRPQKRYLIILNLGRGEGLAIRGRMYWRGRMSLWLKNRLDTRFLDRYRI